MSQSKATAAAPVLADLSQDATLSDHEGADIARMEATVQYLLNDEPGPSYCDAADRALSVSRRTGDLELIGKALFECARSGVNAGDEARVAAAQRETDLAISQCDPQPVPILLYTRAYCDFFFYELASAAKGLERAIAALSQRVDPVSLALAHTGYGTCKSGLCEFDAACEAYDKALQLSGKIGDDLRSAIITSNLCVAKLHRGDFESAVSLGELAVSRAARALSPRLVTIHLNLALATLMRGDSEGARRSIEAAEASSRRERSWAATMEFLLGLASTSLILGDTALALKLIGRAEQQASGKERAVPHAGLFDELRVIRTAHIAGPSAARRIALDAQARYRGRHHLHYLDVLAARAWLDRLAFGHQTQETNSELQLFDTLDAAGLRKIAVAQGLLEEPVARDMSPVSPTRPYG